jgi:hypothetical protein
MGSVFSSAARILCARKDAVAENAPQTQSLNGDPPTPNCADSFVAETEHEELFQQLLARESTNIHLPNYLRMQPEMSGLEREFMVDWMGRANTALHYDASTVFLTVRLFDRMMSQFEVRKTQQHVLGAACILIAAKFNEAHADRMDLASFAAKLECRKAAVESMELVVLNALKFHVSAVTALDFMEAMLGCDEGVWTDAAPSPCDPQATWLSRYILELTLQFDDLLIYRPSVVAAAVVLLVRHHCLTACHTCGSAPVVADAWPSALQRTTGFSVGQLNKCCNDIRHCWEDMHMRLELVQPNCMTSDIADIGRLHVCEKYSPTEKGAVCWVQPCVAATAVHGRPQPDTLTST